MSVALLDTLHSESVSLFPLVEIEHTVSILIIATHHVTLWPLVASGL